MINNVKLYKHLHANFYESEGRLFRRFRSGPAKSGAEVGYKNGTGYLCSKFGEFKSLLVHRVIFLMHNKYLPLIVDHKDRNILNNLPNNLRDADKRTNGMNRKIHKSNTSGTKGVSFCKRDKRWIARISTDKFKRKVVGRSKNKKEAIEARIKAEKKYYKEFRTSN